MLSRDMALSWSNRREPPDPWTPAERRVLDRLRAPEDVQAFLDALPYNTEITCRSPRRVLRARRAHCFEGALLAAAALAHQGRPPLLVDLRAVRDDDHVIAIFREGGGIGAVAKSNTSGLRFRAPIHRTLRELAISYFDDYFNTERERTLRSFTRPLELTEALYPGWRTAEADLDAIGERLDRLAHRPLLTPRMIRGLARVDARRFEAGFLGADWKGLYKAKRR